MEEYMCKTRGNYGSGVTRPKIDAKDHFELKDQFLKELRDNTFSGSDHEDGNEHIEKDLEIINLFHIPNITQDQIILRAFPMSLTRVVSRWLRNKPSDRIVKHLNEIAKTVLVGIFVEDMDLYLDEGMRDVIVGEPFCKASCVEARRFDGIITIHDGDDSVTYQMVRSHPRFKHLTTKKYNKILPFLKVSKQDKMNEISHSYQKLKDGTTCSKHKPLGFQLMFKREKLFENNFNDWFRKLKLVLRVKKKMYVIEQPLPVAPDSATNVLAEWNALYNVYNEVACLMLSSMTPELHRQFENYSPYEMLQELKPMFQKQVGMKGYVDQLERLGYMLPQDLIICLILNGLTKDFAGFVRNYNMPNMGKTIGELHAMLVEYEKGLPKKAETPHIMMIKGEVSERAIDLEEIQDKDTSPSEITSEIPIEVKGFEPPQEEVIPICRNTIHDRQYGMGLGRSSSWLGSSIILGIKIYRDRSKRLIGLGQNAYMDKILKRYKMDNSKRGHIPMQERFDLNKTQGALTPKEGKRMQNVPYASAVGSIMYVVRCTRPDVAFVQKITSRFQHNPGELHRTAMKNILTYLRNTKNMFLVYGGNPKAKFRVDCYCDAGFETDRDDAKSQTGYVFILNRGAMD
nr:retrotransposon protein, putative, Ty1-copia subclass [Tanacetum cinerariifolium]